MIILGNIKRSNEVEVLMQPDYGKALFWDEEGCCIGGYDAIYIGEDGNEITIDLSGISGLKEWFYNWNHCCPEKFYHKVSCLFESSSGTLTGSSGLL